MFRVSKKQSEEKQGLARSGTPTFVAILFFVGLLVIGGSIMIGRSDNGEIDVTNAINQANVTNAENGTGEQVNAGNPALQSLPNGGLVLPENQPVQTPVVEEPVTGTTTDVIAGTSTPSENETQSTEDKTNEATPSGGSEPTQ